MVGVGPTPVGGGAKKARLKTQITPSAASGRWRRRSGSRPSWPACSTPTSYGAYSAPPGMPPPPGMPHRLKGKTHPRHTEGSTAMRRTSGSPPPPLAPRPPLRICLCRNDPGTCVNDFVNDPGTLLMPRRAHGINSPPNSSDQETCTHQIMHFFQITEPSKSDEKKSPPPQRNLWSKNRGEEVASLLTIVSPFGAPILWRNETPGEVHYLGRGSPGLPSGGVMMSDNCYLLGGGACLFLFG